MSKPFVLPLAALLTLPLCAQNAGHPGAIGGSVSHPAGPSSLHAPGPGMRTSPGFAPRSFPRSPQHAPYSQGYGNWTSAGFIPSPNSGSNEYRHGGRYGRGYGRQSYFPFLGGLPLYGYGDIGYSDLNYDPNDPNNPPQTPNEAQNPMGGAPSPDNSGYPGGYGPPDQGPYPPRQPYTASTEAPAPAPNSSAPASDGLKHPKVTFLFRDGRKPMEVQSYAVTPTKIFISDDGAQRAIPLADVDIPATITTNEQAGVEVSLPGAQ